MMSAQRRLGAAGAVALLVLLAGLEFHRVFGWGPITVRIMAAVAIALGIRLAAAWWKPELGLAVTGSASALVLILAVPTLTAGSAPTPGAFRLAFDGLLNGWSRILSSPLPVAAHADLLVLPVVLTWVATLCATEIALRTRRPALAVVIPTTAFGFALIFGIGGPGSRVVSAAVFCIVAAAYCLLARSSAVVVAGREGRRLRAPSHRLMVGGLIGAACVAGAALVGPVLPGVGHPYDPRRTQQPPHHQLAAIDPMSLIAGWAQNPEPVLFTVTAAKAKAWRLAVVDRYDPETGWSSSDTFKPIGATIAVLPPSAPVIALTEKFTISRLPGVWLPLAGQPRTLSDRSALFDRTGDVVAYPGGVGDGLRYTVLADVPAVPSDCTVASAAPLAPADVASSVPSELAALARKLTVDVTSACGRAKALANFLRSSAFAFNKDAPSGSSLARITDLVSTNSAGASGTSEQFATAFALMARSVGLPTRIVVGFHAGEHAEGSADFRVHAGDGFAWAEVNFQGVGWVAFSPTPVPGDQAPPPEVKQDLVDQKPSTDAGGGLPVPTPVVEGTLKVAHRSTGYSPFVPGLAAVAILLLLTGTLGGLVTVTRVRRRSNRRGAADPRVRLVGAWRQCLDALRSVGLGPVESDSAAECAGRASALGEESSRELAGLAVMVNQSLFSSVPPDSGAVDQAWTFADRVEARVAEHRTASDKVRYALDPRVLVKT